MLNNAAEWASGRAKASATAALALWRGLSWRVLFYSFAATWCFNALIYSAFFAN